MIDQIIREFANKKIIILGFGKEGHSTYRFIRKYFPTMSITIGDQDKTIKDDPELLQDTCLNLITGDNYLENLDQYDLIMKSPGISFKDINIDKIKHKISSQLEILLKYYSKQVIGITGTKGKSTTSTLLYEALKQNHKNCYLLGNIGNPIFNDIEKFIQDDLLVVEMSSHQLEFVTSSPHIAIITNFYEDHLDHTNSIEEYYQAKLNITKFQNNTDYLIYYNGCQALSSKISQAKLKATTLTVNTNQQAYTYCDHQFIYVDNNNVYDINQKRQLSGKHNLINIMLVLTLTHLMHLNNKITTTTINNFTPLAHRLENVGTYNDITYYNDAIATIPDATIYGIEALKIVNTLIFGGLDRGIHYETFIQYLYECNIENLICMPKTGHTIGHELLKRNTNKKVFIVNTLEEAVLIAKKVTKPKTICLMSPAAASYEYFKNFEEKGTMFKNLVKNTND